MKKRFLSTVLALTLIFSLFSALTVTAHAASNPYPYWQTFTYGGREHQTITCTYYVWQQVHDRNGIALPGWGNAGTWLDYAKNAGYQVGTEARSDSIAVWRPSAGNSWGHVAYVTAVNGGSLTYNEGGTADRRANYIGIYENHTLPDGYTSWPDGFIYLEEPQPPSQDSEQVCDLGRDFYGCIGYNHGWLQTTGAPIQDGEGHGMDVRITTKPNLSDPHQIWHFIRQDSGSYKIVNMGSNWCLDVQTGKAQNKQNVWTWSFDHGDVPERWYFVTVPGKSGYRLVTAIDSRYCMDIPGGDVHEGANAEIYTRNGNPWQFFTITRLENYNPAPAAKQAQAVTVKTLPTASAITIGQELLYSRVSGGTVVDSEGKNVPGSWLWPAPNTKPNSTGEFEATFVPDDASKYELAAVTIPVTVNPKPDPCAQGHSWGGWAVQATPTCTRTGSQVRVCSACGAQDTKTVTALGHSWQPAGAGYSVCANCGDVLNTGAVVPDGNDGFAVTPNTPGLSPSAGISSSNAIGLNNFLRVDTYCDGLFRDVPAGSWYARNVVLAYEFGLMNGRSDGQFAPESNMTIAETITLAARVHSIYTYGKKAFTTYDGGNWFDPFVDYTRAEGICTENYDYNRPATRDEFVHILVRALPQEALAWTKDASSFADTGNIVHANDVEWLYRAGVIGGVDESGLIWFKPNQTVTRAEAAAIVTRMVRTDMRL